VRGKRAKQLRKASKYNTNTWQQLESRDKYTYKDGIRYTRGARTIYQLMKKYYYETK